MSSNPLFAKLKPGPGSSPDKVRTNQRARLQTAMIELVAERGYAGLTVRALTRTSGVSTRTFYAHFANLDDCLASTYRAIVGRVRDRLSLAMAAGGDRETALRAWLRQLTESVAENPAAAGLALVAAYDGGPAMLAEVGQGIAELERQLLAIRPALPVPLAQAIAAGIERVLRTWLLAGRQAELPRVADDLTDWVLNVVNVDTTRQLKSRPDPSESSRLLDHVGRGDPSLAVFEAIGGERGRILAATARLGASDGYRSLTAPRIRRQAGVSRRNFELLFDGVASCYLEAIEVLMHAAVARAARRPTTAGDWASRIERLTRRFCAEVSGSPLLARLGFTGVLEPGGEGLRCRENLLTSAASWLRAEAPQPLRPAPLAVEASLAASWRVVQADLMTGFNSRRDATILAHLLLAPPLVKRQAERVK